METDNKLRILGFQKSSTIDYPGCLASVIYLGGCNLRCPYCHNRSLVLQEDKEMFLDIVVSYLRIACVRNVVLTGGEPLLYHGSQELSAMMEALRRIPVRVKLDTNGLLVQLRSSQFVSMFDYIAIDYKAPISGYKFLFGNVSEEQSTNLKANMTYLMGVNITGMFDLRQSRGEFRTTVHKSLLDYDDIKDMASELKNMAARCTASRLSYEKPDADRGCSAWLGSWYLQQYRPCPGFDPELMDTQTYSDEELTDIAIEVGAIVRGVRDDLVTKSVNSAMSRLKEAFNYDVRIEELKRAKRISV